MRAWRVHQHGHWREQLRLEEAPDPAPPGDGVVVAAAAAALNFPDLLAIAGQYQVKPPLPFVPGMEAAGEVVTAGARSTLRPGQRVIVSGTGGAFAERIAARDAFCYPVPDAMTDADAAALLVAYQTGWLALVRRARLRAGETLLVHGGAGGVGTAAIQLGKALGARVIASASGAAKLDVCRGCGADDVFDYRERPIAETVAELTGGRGADVIYDGLGRDAARENLAALALRGHWVSYGHATGPLEPMSLAEKSGTLSHPVLFHHTADFLHQMAGHVFTALRDRVLTPAIRHRYPLAAAADAHRDLEARRTTGQIVLLP
jgi:NADPH2:quinone reductase